MQGAHQILNDSIMFRSSSVFFAFFEQIQMDMKFVGVEIPKKWPKI